MAMKLQSKSYLPGYSLMRDLNEDSTNTWSRYYLETKVNEHLYDNSMQHPVNGYTAFDKEMLKRTMLEHEMVFQKQVHELHRLYRIQKDMMDEFQTRGLNRSSEPDETSQSNSFSSQMRSENSQMIWQSSHFALAKNCYDNMPFVSTHDIKVPMSLIKEGSVQSGLIPVQNNSSLKKNILVDHKVQSQSRKMLDLHLPADTYIDLEDEDTSQTKEVAESSAFKEEVPCTIKPASIVNLTLLNGEGSSSRKDECSFGLKTVNSTSTENNSALNKLTTKACTEGLKESVSLQFLGLKYHTERNLEHHLTMRSHGHDEYRLSNKPHISDFRCLDGETNGQFPIFTNNVSGRSGKDLDLLPQSLYTERFSSPSGPLQLNLEKIHENLSLDSNKSDTWFKQKKANGIETSTRGNHAKSSNNSGSVFPFMPASFSVPHNNFASSSCSFVSSGTKPLNGISHPQALARELPCLNTSSNDMTRSVITNAPAQNVVGTSEKWQKHDSLMPSHGNSVAIQYSIGPYHNFCRNSSNAQKTYPSNKLNNIGNANNSTNGRIGHQPTKSVSGFQHRSLLAVEEINLNQALPCETDDDLREQDGSAACSMERKNKDLSGVPSWLRKPECPKQYFDLNSFASEMELSFSDDRCQMPSTIFSSPKIWKEVNTIESSVRSSSLQAKDKETQPNEVYGHANKRSYSFLISEKIQQISTIHPSVHLVEQPLTNNQKSKEKDVVFSNELGFVQEISKSKVVNVERSKDMVGTSYKNCIDLNVEFSCDEEALPNSEIEFQLPNSSGPGTAKTSSEIDLEVPIYQGEISIISKHEFINLNEMNSSQEKEGSFDVLARLAAENIVAISMHQTVHQDEANYHDIASCDSLYLFAEVALSVNEGAKEPITGKDGCQFFDDNKLDLFEAMTLELEEVKVHDLLHKPVEPVNKEDTDDEDIGAASLLFTRRRRGQARRRRQRKDFQKDILPGLVSLSRHEVTEDIQLIDGLMKASGGSWQSGLSRRNSGRNGTKSRAKGRKQLANFCTTAVEIETTPHLQPPVQPSNNEPDVVGSSMIGWGRTTRRCRRQKSLPGNVVSSLA